ncbi:NUDIX hydrolase [Hymenobacter taeanensis]|uniref:NUDIX hydrolase n=1 Tax=Hymenobacter taeanensis TaxID=2735321 RepID=A0A6M6BIZ3_9BACT|nr:MULTISPECIES: NUDIX domain-containing protein [Hymenobacter]QJX48087.1 NUDIX hydrolase [Hymenobacter taeanensis]UOQ82451.1 NUDIX domain-containing protein [Hymenobacter sp. 5414T-23]
MNTRQEVLDFVHNGHQHYLPHLSIDCVIFGYHAHQLKILLIRHHGHEKWSLPGGYIARNETLTQSAHRILAEKTQLSNLFLQQFYVFGDSATRMNRIETHDTHNTTYAKVGVALGENHWLSERTLSIGYYALVDYLNVVVTPDLLVDAYCWQEVTDVPALDFDHNEIVQKALMTLRAQLYQQPIGYNLLAEKFTLPEIHALYEAILGRQFDRRNFRKKLLTLGLIRQLEERRKIGPHRSPYLYEFDPENYQKALEEGAVLAQ